jgi:uncharacterized protein YdeI (YjbR/CyaY-like superfamily)
VPTDDIITFRPTSRHAWRQWLKVHHESEPSVWLVLYKKEANKPTISWSEAVDEALCFGWVDSKRKPLDGEKFIQFFSKRKLKGTWSKINKEKVLQLIAQKKMAKAGLRSIETAKQNGSWTILDAVEELKIPNDLAKEFRIQPGSKAFFLSLSKSVRKSILQWLVLAKRPETRQKRVEEVAALAAQKLRPKQFR